jgi:hypothetical protein
MKKPYMLVYILMLLAAIGYFVLGIVALVAKATGGVLGINIGAVEIFAGVMMLVILLITYNLLKKEK